MLDTKTRNEILLEEKIAKIDDINFDKIYDVEEFANKQIENFEDISKFSRILGNYSGERTALHKALFSHDFYENAKEKALNYYLKFVEKGADNSVFEIPEYNY